MTIQSEIQSLAPTDMVELFVLDMTSLPGGELSYFHAGANGLQQPVVWQGQSYTPWPIEAEGFDVTTHGALPRPKVRVANINGLFSAEVLENDDLVGCKVIRKRTFARFLDAVNFTGGVNPDADSSGHFSDDVWYIERKLSESRYVIEWELSSVYDLDGVQLPGRQVIQNSCPWQYRQGDCNYTGPNIDRNNQPSTLANDFCNKSLTACKVRFSPNPLPFGGFPGATRRNG